MSITEELRDCIRTANRSYEDARNPFDDREVVHILEEELLAIADRIDKEHAEAVADALQLRGEPDRWVELPVDADGVPIHVGDELTTGMCGGKSFIVRTLHLSEEGEWALNDYFPIRDLTIRHVQPDSWERIIRDIRTMNGCGSTDEFMERHSAELVERCRRLAGEGA